MHIACQIEQKALSELILEERRRLASQTMIRLATVNYQAKSDVMADRIRHLQIQPDLQDDQLEAVSLKETATL